MFRLMCMQRKWDKYGGPGLGDGACGYARDLPSRNEGRAPWREVRANDFGAYDCKLVYPLSLLRKGQKGFA